MWKRKIKRSIKKDCADSNYILIYEKNHKGQRYYATGNGTEARQPEHLELDETLRQEAEYELFKKIDNYPDFELTLDELLAEFDETVDIPMKMKLFKDILELLEKAPVKGKWHNSQMKEIRKEWYRLWKRFYAEYGKNSC
jgi:hypothetical protein